MSVIEAISLLTSSGVLAGGVGVLKWVLQTEKRLLRVEIKTGISSPI